jgi:diamine N-acetyltransferase
MATVELRDIVTDADRAAALAVQVAPEQDQFVASVAQSFQDAVDFPHAKPRYWTINDGDDVVGFVMLSDGVDPEVVARDTHMVGPYFLWRLLIDRRHQRRGYGAAALDAVVAYVRTRPDATELLTSYSEGEGNPRPFYEGYGFVATDRIVDGERVLRLEL